MIACILRSTAIYYRVTNTSSATDATDDTTCPMVYVASDGWQEISEEAFVWVVTKVEEPAQEPDEPNTVERTVNWERPHRRLATVTGLRRLNRRTPQKAASSWG